MVAPAWSTIRGVVLAVLLSACSGDPPEERPDASNPDAGLVDAGTGDAGQPPLDGGTSPEDAGTCGDDDPCTVEQRDDAGRCVVSPAPDGTACDDGDACTTQDQCVSGVCGGSPTTSAPTTYGTAWSHGPSPAERSTAPLEGLAEFVSDDRLLFGDRLGGSGLSVSLVRVTEDGLTRLDHAALDIRVDRFFGTTDWSDRMLTFFVPLGPDRVLVVGSRQRLELLGLEGDRLTTLARLPLHPSSNSILGGAGRGAHFWLCNGSAVTPYRIDPGNVLVADDAHNLQLPGTCNSLSVSPDGNTLWVGTTRGLAPVDITKPEEPVLKPTLLSGLSLFQAQGDGTFVVAHELLRYGQMGRILVYRQSDLGGTATPTPVKSFLPVEETSRWERPVGFVLLQDALLVEWVRLTGPTRAYVVERHALNASGVSSVVATQPLRQSEEVGLTLSPFQLAGRGRHAVLQPWRRVVAMEGTDALRFRTGIHHGSFERVQAAPDGSLLAVGPFGSHRVSVDDPAAPAVLSGGTTLAADTQRLRIAPARPGSATRDLVTLPAAGANVHQEAGTAVMSCLRSSVDGLLEPDGQVRLAGGPAVLASAKGQLFQAAPIPSGGFKLRRFALDVACAGQDLAPASEQTVTVDPAPPDTRKGHALAVDGDRSELLLGEMHYVSPDKPARMPLLWRSWSGEGGVATGELTGSTDQFTAMALAGGRGLVIENGREVYLLERAGTRIETRAHVNLAERSAPVDVSRILAFDGAVAYLAISTVPSGVLALRADDLSEIGRYPTPAPVRSLTFAGSRLVLGMNEALTVAAPACPAAPVPRAR
ncbi:hypothetical protein [Corallococcus carmarthensis]|uniref:Uncharacterized protein n=1 Tax=Corallococcus carmarthensis TaxID=2316728 RepID=A0A3A8K9F1_9BACT|nr:hypothetical protein [Corallococcus carmarthensis]NOK18900.1 hypothetical protein [Corallococcus carmarthensis]RKH04136.1 hypothetical protein D7X32_12035 [Corallococcus carmarthensis]